MNLIRLENKSLGEKIDNSCKVKKNLLQIEIDINKAINIVYKSIKNGGKLLLCGNGGSAADAQHLAAEFLIRLRPNINRKPFAALTLAQDTSTITACSNDYNFNFIFSRNLEALGHEKDVLIAISTSGNSKNIIEVLKVAKKKKIYSIGFLGSKGGNAKKNCNLPLIVDSDNTATIQECHIFLGHFILEKVEDLLEKKI
jgi:D-sedoheptulose 7-phosphate isomerase